MNFVTGGTGLVGSRIISDLLWKGEEVLALKRPGSETQYLKDVLNFWHPGKDFFSKINWVDGDIRDIYSIQDPISHSKHVYHAAALVSFHKKDASALKEINIEGTANVVNSALDSEVEKLCFISSTAALGRTKSGSTITEDSVWKDSKLNTRYAVSKYESENEVWRGSQEGLKVVIVNPSVVIGPGQKGRSSGALFTQIERGLPFYPNGSNAFVSSKDVSKACIELMNSEIFNERYLLAGENMEFKKVFGIMADALGKKRPDKLAKKWMLEVGRWVDGMSELFSGKRASITKETVMNSGKSYFYDSSKIIEDLNFEYCSIESSVKEVVDFLKA